MDDIERCLLVKSEVFVFNIPPRQSARGYRAADWNLSAPDWTGRLRVMEKNKKVKLKLEDKNSGDLFAACPIDTYPGPSLEAVTDSSRYFVIRIVNEADNKTAFVGMGFSDRSDSFDLNVALQDHFNFIKKEVEILQEDKTAKPLLDLAFKDGETIKVNINVPKRDKTKPARTAGLGGPLLPPPPGGSSTRPTAAASQVLRPAAVPPLSNPSTPTGPPPQPAVDLLCDLSGLDLGPSSGGSTAVVAAAAASDDPWGDFASADGGAAKPSGNWVQF